MDRKNWMMLFGVGLMLLFFGLYYIFKSPIYLFNITIGALALVYGFYTEGKEIKVSLSYCVASSTINIIQWLMIYSFYYSPVHQSIQFNMSLGVTILTTIFLINRLHKEYVKTLESDDKTTILLKDNKRITFICTGLILMTGSLTGFIVYHAFTFFYITSLGLTIFVYGYYHENGKINLSVKYIEVMAVTMLLQWIVLSIFFHQMLNEISTYDWTFLFTLSMIIGCYFIVQFIMSDITLSDLILD